MSYNINLSDISHLVYKGVVPSEAGIVQQTRSII